MKIYVAGSFAHKDIEIAKARKNDMLEAAKILREKGIEAFLPFEHPMPNAWDMPNNDWGCAVYGADMLALQTCDCLVYLSYGKINNSDGSAWEAGFACALGKHIIVVSLTDELESIMVKSSCRAHLKGLAQLKDYDFEKMPIVRNCENEIN